MRERGATPVTRWGDPDVVVHFGTEGTTDAGEAAAFEHVGAQARGRVLDLGIGGGRTTGLLAPAAASYVGVDLAPEMLAVARRRFPDLDLRVGDAADLGEHADASYDLVVFSYNGLDALTHEARLTCLREMARVVAPEGRVLFSSLNLDGVSFDERPWHVRGGLRSARVRYHLLQALRHPASAVRSVRHYRHTRTEGESGPGWAERPLRAHEFRFVVHFATLGEVVAEARDAGLVVESVHADDGRRLDPGDGRTDADYVHLVCRRA